MKFMAENEKEAPKIGQREEYKYGFVTDVETDALPMG
jgi:hypothetical protein